MGGSPHNYVSLWNSETHSYGDCTISCESPLSSWALHSAEATWRSCELHPQRENPEED